MGGLSEIYARSPRFLQDLYVNAYGLRNVSRFRKRDRILRDLERFERMERPAQIEYVQERLKGVLSHAVAHVPFYRKYARLAAGLDRRSVFEALLELPVVDKETINREPEAFLSDRRDRDVISRTSGTTGTPFSVHMDPGTFLLTDALWWRRTLWAGYERGDWVARLVGDPVIPLSIKSPSDPWRVSRFDRRIYFSSFHLDRGTAIRIGEFLNRKRPAFLMGYPSSLEIFSNYLRQSGFKRDWELKSVLFSSEPMFAHQELAIREVFGPRIRGLYGSGERVVSAAQCEHGNYHLSVVDGYIEGQFGILEGVQPAAVTTLTNLNMPLIRYQVGDEMELQPGLECPCGRTLPVISPVITKHEDYVITPSGRRIPPSPIVWAFIHQDIRDIHKSQVVQEDEHTVRVYLDTDEESFLKYRDVLKRSMTDVFFGEMAVEIVRADHIDVQKSGKSRFIVNRLQNTFRDVSTGTDHR